MLSHGYVRIMEVNLDKGKGRVIKREDLVNCLGGSGLAAALYQEYGLPEESPFHPDQPLIFAIGPLNGLFPLMSKVVLGFKSPYNGYYAETHAGGRMGTIMRFADIDALVIRGKAQRPSYLVAGSREMNVKDARHLWGLDTTLTARLIRQKEARAHGKRSILRIGVSGENLVKIAGINVDTFRHFGRLGAGALMGSKFLKAIMLIGDTSFDLDFGSSYKKLYKKLFQNLVGSDLMTKYHGLGTTGNVLPLEKMKSLPVKNLQATTFPEAEGISGEYFADNLLLRQIACTGCPIGCIHIGLLREKFGEEHEYCYRQVSYDHEPVFAMGSMLGISRAEEVITLLDQVEKFGLDVISAGVALAWATEALEKGLISKEETLVPYKFGSSKEYLEGIQYLSEGTNEFYRLLGEGVSAAASNYGGEDFACVLGQEMAGYATGPIFFVSQAMGFRHSHLDTAGYQLDQMHEEFTPERAVELLEKEERQRVLLTSMVACLFARKLYTPEVLQEALEAVGLKNQGKNLEELGEEIRRLRWRVKFSTGFTPEKTVISRRFTEIENFKGVPSGEYMKDLIKMYSRSINNLRDKES